MLRCFKEKPISPNFKNWLCFSRPASCSFSLWIFSLGHCVSGSPWTGPFLLPDRFLTETELRVPCSYDNLNFSNTQWTRKGKTNTIHKGKKKSQTVKKFLLSWWHRKKKQPHLHSLKGDSALAVYRVVEWKWCSDHKRHKTLCAQQFAQFLPTILVGVMQVLFPQACFILCN